MDASLFDGWIPIRTYRCDERMWVDWCYAGERRFTEPFFNHTVSALLRRPFNLLFRRQTPLDALGEQQAAAPGLKPSGFIFHLSRCGSTLLSQMLAALPQASVMSEAGPIDSVLRAAHHKPSVTDEQRVEWLRWMVGALGRRPTGQERQYFIKLDSWHVLELPLFRRAFPDVPWVFVYRNPVEVMVSQTKQRGAQMVPGLIEPDILGLSPEARSRLSLDEYGVRVLAKFCGAALDNVGGGRGRLLNYSELPAAAWTTLAAHFDLALNDAEIETMRAATRADAKNPALDFAADTDAKNRAASPELRALCDELVGPLYARLERERIGREQLEREQFDSHRPTARTASGPSPI